MLTRWKESYDQPRQHIKKQSHYFANKSLHSQNYGFSSSHVWTCELDCKESWAPIIDAFWTVVLEKTPHSALDCKEIKPVSPKGNQSWIFIGRTDTEAPTLWPPDVKDWLFQKDPDAGQDLRQEEKGTAEGEMVGWLQHLYVHEFEDAPGVGEGQGSLECCSPSVVILELKKIKSVTVSTFPIYLPWSDGTGCNDLSFYLFFNWNVIALQNFVVLSNFNMNQP